MLAMNQAAAATTPRMMNRKIRCNGSSVKGKSPISASTIRPVRALARRAWVARLLDLVARRKPTADRLTTAIDAPCRPAAVRTVQRLSHDRLDQIGIAHARMARLLRHQA